MPRDQELTFADHLGRFYSRRYAFPPMAGRVLGYLLVCEPRKQTIAELAEALLASRSAVAGALGVLEPTKSVQRARVAGERVDRVWVDLTSAEARGFDLTEYQELGDLAREGLEVIEGAPEERRRELLEMAAFADFLVGEVPSMRERWEAHRDRLRAAGELPE